MSAHIIEANDGNFDQVVLQTAGPVLVDFWAEWCGPCRRLAPTVEALAEEYTTRVRVVKLNVDGGPATAKRYGIQGIPTLILFKDGAEKERIVGAADKEAIAALIDRHSGDLAVRKVG
ncbi:MAG: thioredoxin [Candidatus Binatia bacterium]